MTKTQDEAVEQRLGPYTVTAATTYGPRITGLRRDDGPQILAELGPEVRIQEHWTFLFRGGHRLWAAPEVAETTYAPDDHDCDVEAGPQHLTVRGPVDQAGFARCIEVSPAGDDLIVDHTLFWAGIGQATTAPWAITQLPLGGRAILPLHGRETPHQANRSLILWPYSRLDDHRVQSYSSGLVITAEPGVALKFGSGPEPGWLGYLLDGWLFSKQVPRAREEGYVDLGAVGQVFVNESFCELESVGAPAVLQSGETLSHRERWRVDKCSDLSTAIELLERETTS